MNILGLFLIFLSFVQKSEFIIRLIFIRFAAFGAGETTSLRIYRRDVDINDREIDEQADPYDDETNSATVSSYLISFKSIRVE